MGPGRELDRRRGAAGEFLSVGGDPGAARLARDHYVEAGAAEPDRPERALEERTIALPTPRGSQVPARAEENGDHGRHGPDALPSRRARVLIERRNGPQRPHAPRAPRRPGGKLDLPGVGP